MANIIACRPPSMRLAISISPSRVSSSTVPISRMYMRTGSVVRPNSESTVDSAASAASSASSSVAVVAPPPAISRVAASGACSYTAMPMSLSIETIASRISWSTSFSGRWSLISWCVRKPRVLPILMSVFSSWRRLATSSSVSAVSSRPNSRISARSLARETFIRSGLALAVASSDRLALEVGLDLRQVDIRGFRLGRSCRPPCPPPPCPWPPGPCPWPAPTPGPPTAAFAAALAGFLISSAALAGLAAGAALVGAVFLAAVMQILGRWWACGSGGPNQELRAAAPNSRLRVSRGQMRQTARATRNPQGSNVPRAVAG